MKREDWDRTGRNIWGWFAICVWIVGVPQVIKYSVKGVKSAVTEASNVLGFETNYETEMNKITQPKNPTGKDDVNETMTREEFEIAKEAVNEFRQIKGK